MPYVAATCLATGTVEHYACSGCSTLFADAEGKQPMEKSIIIPYLTHEMADGWNMDEQFHWRTCKLCQSILDETQMVHEYAEGKCTTCGHAEGAEVTPTQEPEQSGEGNGIAWWNIASIAFICLGVLVGIAVCLGILIIIISLLRKKKNQ